MLYSRKLPAFLGELAKRAVAVLRPGNSLKKAVAVLRPASSLCSVRDPSICEISGICGSYSKHRKRSWQQRRCDDLTLWRWKICHPSKWLKLTCSFRSGWKRIRAGMLWTHWKNQLRATWMCADPLGLIQARSELPVPDQQRKLKQRMKRIKIWIRAGAWP